MADPQGWTLVQPATPSPSANGWTLVQPAQAPTVDRPISRQAEQVLKRTDLPDSVRAEMEAIRTGTAPNTRTNVGAVVNAWGDAGPHRVVEGIKNIGQGNYAKGANDIIVGGGITAAPMLAPAAIPAVVAAPGAAALTIGTGIATQQAVPPIARAMGATPDQAELAGTITSTAAGTAMAKYGVPALTRWSANNKAVQMGRDYLQSTRDVQAALGVNADDVHRARPFLETVHNNGIPIVGKEDAVSQFVKAADVAINEIEQHVAGLVQQFPDATVSPMEGAVLKRVSQMPGASPADLNAARKVTQQYGLDQPRSLAEAESLRIRLNAENKSILEGTGVKQRTAVLTNPAYVARQEAANQLRDGIYGALEQRGIQGIRDLRLSEGSILKLRNAADPITRSLRSESTVARTGQSSLGRRLVQRVAPGLGAGAGASIGGVPGAAVGAELGRELTAGLTATNLNKNELLERAFRQTFTSPPVMSVQGIPGSQAGGTRTPSPHGPGSLPPASLPPSRSTPQLPPPAPSQLPAQPQRLALPAHDTVPVPTAVEGTRVWEMPPVPDESSVTGVRPRSTVVRDPKTGRMKRVYLGEGK